MKKRILSIILLFSLLFTNFTVYAETEEITTDKVASSVVNAEVNSSFSVQIPKSITLISDDEGYYGSYYTVSLKGNIAGNESLFVTPDETVTLTEGSKDNISAMVYQEATGLCYDEINNEFAELKGVIFTEEKLSAGNWTGSLNFDIKLNEINFNKGAGLYKRNGQLFVSYDSFIAQGYDISSDYDSESNSDIFFFQYIYSDELTMQMGINNMIYGDLSDEDSLKIFQCELLILPNSISSIGYMQLMMMGEYVKKIILPESLEIIGETAFINTPDEGNINYLESVTLPSSIKSIGNMAFSYNCNLKEIIYNGITYTSITKLITALTDNGVAVGTDVFSNTGLSE